MGHLRTYSTELLRPPENSGCRAQGQDVADTGKCRASGAAKEKDALPTTLLERLRVERQMQLHGGIYHKVQVDLTYNSNHMEGSRLTHDQARFIYETNTIGVENEALNVDDVLETSNHFRCIDLVIDKARAPLTEALIKELHRTLKNGTSDSRKTWFAVGTTKR